MDHEHDVNNMKIMSHVLRIQVDSYVGQVIELEMRAFMAEIRNISVKKHVKK